MLILIGFPMLNWLESRIRTIKNIKLRILILALLGFSTNNFGGKDTTINTKESIKQNINAIEIKNPVRQVNYYVDTISRKKNMLLYYSKNKIIRNFMNNENLYKMSLALFAHEDWHEHNNTSGFRDNFLLTSQERHNLYVHDEISANIVALLIVRYQYLASENKNDFIKKYENKSLNFYFQAIKNNLINPEDNSRAARNKEWHFIANQVRDDWMLRCYSHYKDAFNRMIMRMVNEKQNTKNTYKYYLYLKNYMYNIGGVNFASYMDKDVDILDKRINLVKIISNIKSLRKGRKQITEDILNHYERIRNFDIDKQNEIFQNIFIAAKLKYDLRLYNVEKLKENPQIINIHYNKILSLFSKDKSFRHAIKEVNFIQSPTLNIANNTSQYDEILAHIYTYKDFDLRKYITNFNPQKIPVGNSAKNLLIFDDYFGMDNVYKYAYIDTQQKGNIETVNIKEAPQNTTMHRSKMQSIIIPNFREPILLSNDTATTEKIMAPIKDFMKYPDVLKNCNTKAQKEFLRSNPQFILKSSEQSRQ